MGMKHWIVVPALENQAVQAPSTTQSNLSKSSLYHLKSICYKILNWCKQTSAHKKMFFMQWIVIIATLLYKGDCYSKSKYFGV